MVCKEEDKSQGKTHQLIGLDSPVSLAAHAHRPVLTLKVVLSLVRVDVREIQSVLGKRHRPRIAENGFYVGHGEQEHDSIEEQNMDRRKDTERQEG